jgi:hypothetical protein
MDWVKQFRITDSFKNRVMNAVEFIFGGAFLLLVLYLFGRGTQFVADKIRPGHSFENEYSLMKVIPYIVPFVCGIALTAYSYVFGLARHKTFTLRSKTGWYVFLASFLPVFLSTGFFFILNFFLLDESRLIEPRAETFSSDSLFGTILFGMVSIGLSIYLRNKFCAADKVKLLKTNSTGALLKQCWIIFGLCQVFTSNAFSMETGKVIKLVASNSDKRGQIAGRAFFERVTTGDCDGSQELLTKLKPLVDVSGLAKEHFFICDKSTVAIAEAFAKLSDGEDIKRTAKDLRIRRETSETKDAFIQNSLLTAKFNNLFPMKYTGAWSSVRLYLNAGSIREAKENFAVTYGKNPTSPDYQIVAELMKIAESDSQFVADASYRLSKSSRKELYLSGVREWLKKYPETLNAQAQLKELLTQRNRLFDKEALAEFYRYQNERKYSFLTTPAPEVCLRNRAALERGAAKKTELKGIGASGNKLVGGWLLNTCAVMVPASYDILSIGSFLSKDGKDFPFGKVLPYYGDGWHENEEFYDSTATVISLTGVAGPSWIIGRHCKDVPGEVGSRKFFYSVNRLDKDGPKEVHAFEGFGAADGGESWGQEYGFEVDSSNALLATETHLKSEILYKEINQDQIDKQVFRWNGTEFAPVSTSSDNQLYQYGQTFSGAQREYVEAVITGDLYKTQDLNGPKPVTNMEVLLLSRLHGTIEPRNAVVLKVCPKENPNEIWYVRPESAGEIGARLGRSQ